MNKLTVPPTCYYLCTTLLLVAGPLACSRETNEGQTHIESAVSQREVAPAASVRAVSVDSRTESVAGNNDVRVTLRDGKLRIFFVAGDEELALIRIRNDSRQTLSEKEQAEIRASESDMVKRWLKSKSRFETKPPSTPLEEHDALLEVADRLEPLHKEDPEHLGILRDLLTVYTQLLAFEQGSDLGSNLCVLASDKLVGFERGAAPLDSNDQQLLDHIRAWLHYVMHHYPTAALSGNDVARNALRVLDQQYFETQPSFRIGRLQAEVYRTLGKSPDPDLLWDAVHILVGYLGGDNPAHTVAYTLCAQGPPERQRWYLMGHVLNRTSLIRLFGTRRPEFNEIQALVTQHTRSLQPHAKQSREASEGRGR